MVVDEEVKKIEISRFYWSTQMGLEREVSILGFKKAQVFCIKNSSCVKTGKSLRAIATYKSPIVSSISSHTSQSSVKTGKSLRAIAEIWE